MGEIVRSGLATSARCWRVVVPILGVGAGTGVAWIVPKALLRIVPADGVVPSKAMVESTPEHGDTCRCAFPCPVHEAGRICVVDGVGSCIRILIRPCKKNA